MPRRASARFSRRGAEYLDRFRGASAGNHCPRIRRWWRVVGGQRADLDRVCKTPRRKGRWRSCRIGRWHDGRLVARQRGCHPLDRSRRHVGGGEGVAAEGAHCVGPRRPQRFLRRRRTDRHPLRQRRQRRHIAPWAKDLPKGEAFLRAVPEHAGDLWLCSWQGLFRSTDGGEHFENIGGIDNAKRIGFGKPAPNESYPAIYLVGNAAGVYGFFRSDDAGKTWVRINDDQHQFANISSITGDPRVLDGYTLGPPPAASSLASPRRKRRNDEVDHDDPHPC